MTRLGSGEKARDGNFDRSSPPHVVYSAFFALSG